MTWSTGIATAPRLFVASPLAAGVDVPASPNQAHYLSTVLRRNAGDPVRLFNGADGEWLARVPPPAGGRARKAAPVLTVERQIRPQPKEAGPWLVFALLKRDATDLVVRQAVELGVSRVLPVLTARTNAARVNEERLRAIALEAAEQCERLTIPAIESPRPLDAVLETWPTGRRLFAALERSAVSPPEPGLGEAALLVGPEGGFAPGERDRLTRKPFVAPISLGPFVLRAETAAAAGLALVPAMGWAEYVGST